jgi:hypothetical protein
MNNRRAPTWGARRAHRRFLPPRLRGSLQKSIALLRGPSIDVRAERRMTPGRGEAGVALHPNLVVEARNAEQLIEGGEGSVLLPESRMDLREQVQIQRPGRRIPGHRQQLYGALAVSNGFRRAAESGGRQPLAFEGQADPGVRRGLVGRLRY